MKHILTTNSSCFEFKHLDASVCCHLQAKQPNQPYCVRHMIPSDCSITKEETQEARKHPEYKKEGQKLCSGLELCRLGPLRLAECSNKTAGAEKHGPQTLHRMPPKWKKVGKAECLYDDEHKEFLPLNKINSSFWVN